MDRANVTKIHTSPSAEPFPPLMSMHFTKTIILIPQAPLSVSQLRPKFEYQ